MKHLLLVHHDETAFAQLAEATRRDMLAESVQLTHALHADGQYVHASPLHPAATAAVVRVRDGGAFVTDGPFIETKEQLAGYYLIEASDLAAATEIAKRIPGARIGSGKCGRWWQSRGCRGSRRRGLIAIAAARR